MNNSLLQDIGTLLSEYGMNQESISLTQRLLVILLIIFVAYLTDFICRKMIVPVVKRVVASTKATWDDILLSDKVLNNLCHIVPSIFIYVLLPFAFSDVPSWLHFLMKISLVYIIAATLKLICSFLTALYNLSAQHKELKDRPLKGVYQMLKIITIFLGVIGIVSVLIDKSPVVLFTGLGAAATVLMLIFKDTIVGLVAGVQLSANDMLRPGDWITMDKSGANGIVTEVTLTTVKVRNWDNTITTIPPYTLVSDSFRNWRNMQQSGGRRVKRSIYIDVRTIRFCTPDELQRFVAKGWVSADEATAETVNLGVFRRFLERYLSESSKVNSEMMLMVRQLQPTPQGLPLELYFFTTNTNWVPYEHIQADIFDHVLAILPQFGLRLFQSPSGDDLQQVLSAKA